MSLSTEFLDELRVRTQLSALVGKTLRLQKAGNEFKACCPFHNEKTPSFYVNDDKGFWHCFGCGVHGDAIRWVTDTRGLEFLDAVRELAEAAGLEMPAQEQRDERTVGLYEIVGRAERWFRDQLNGLVGSDARTYLESRGVDSAAIEAFGIGFVPEGRNRLRQALSDVGDELLIEAGLLVRPDDEREPYDRFRNRIVFPIRDVRGRVIGFSGRILGPGEPKYLNSPEGPIFSKGRTLFNIDRAAKAARLSGRIVVVEGQMDVLGLAGVGIEDAVAPLGTALTEAQIGLLWRYGARPLICFDGDAAGNRATLKVALRALPGIQPDRSLAFVSLPKGRDPHDVAREGGAAAFDALAARAHSLADVLWHHEASAGPLDTPEARSALRQRLEGHVGAIEHGDVRAEYQREFRARLDRLFAPPPRAARRPPRKGEKRPRYEVRRPEPIDLDALGRKMVTAILRGLARFPDLIAEEAERIARLPVANEAQRATRDRFLDIAFVGGEVDPAEVDQLFPGDLGWKGLRLAFMLPRTAPERARAELLNAIDMVVAQADGADAAALAALAREKHPETEPENWQPRQGSLLG